MKKIIILLLLASVQLSYAENIPSQSVTIEKGVVIPPPREPIGCRDNLTICEQSCKFRRGVQVFSCVGDTIAQDRRYHCKCIDGNE